MVKWSKFDRLSFYENKTIIKKIKKKKIEIFIYLYLYIYIYISIFIFILKYIWKLIGLK